MKILIFAIGLIALAMTATSMVTTINIVQTAEARQRTTDCNDDDPFTVCITGGSKNTIGTGGQGGHCEFDFGAVPSTGECSGGGGTGEDPIDSQVGGAGGQFQCDGDCEKTAGGEGRHVQGEGDEGSEDN